MPAAAIISSVHLSANCRIFTDHVMHTELVDDNDGDQDNSDAVMSQNGLPFDSKLHSFYIPPLLQAVLSDSSRMLSPRSAKQILIQPTAFGLHAQVKQWLAVDAQLRKGTRWASAATSDTHLPSGFQQDT